MGRPRGGGSGTSYGLRRRSGGSVVNPMLYNTGVELMMECFEDVLSPSQIEAARRAKEEFKKAQKKIEEAKAEAARAAAAAEAAAKVEAERQAVVKVEVEMQAAEVAVAASLARQTNAAVRGSGGSTSPDIMIVGESPPLVGQKVAPLRPGQGAAPRPMSGPIINPITTQGVLPPHAAGVPQEMYRFSPHGQNNNNNSNNKNAASAAHNQWLLRPLRPGVAPQQGQLLPRPALSPGGPRQPGPPSAQDIVTIVSGTSGLGIKRAFSSPDESLPGPVNKRARGRFVNDGNNGTGGSWVPLDEYYYGKMEGDPTFSEDKGEFRFRCWICTKMLYNNVKAMMHLQGHIDSEKQQNLDLSDLTQCKHCYKQFDTPFEMQTHIEKVHISYMNVLMCRICEKDHESRGALTNHMRQNHCACEMPYTCQLCHFRSSMYSDVVDHFKKKHNSSDSMLCLYCLRVFHVKFVSQGWGQTQVYYHHLLRHQSKTSNRKCTFCKLSFFNTQDMKAHRKTHHQPNQKGVIGVNQKQTTADQVMIKVPETGIVSNKQGGPKSLNAPAVSKVQEHRGLHFPLDTAVSYCFECKMLMNTGDHYKKYIQCSMCRFATSCSFAYATHMMGFHSGQLSALSRSVPMERPLAAPLYCSCGFSSKFGNKIANHLVFCSKRTGYLNKPEIPQAEKPGQDETDPRHKPDASILDVLGLVKKRSVVNANVEEEDWVHATPELRNIPDEDKAHAIPHLDKVKTPPAEQDEGRKPDPALSPPQEPTSGDDTSTNTALHQHTPDTPGMDTDLAARAASLDESSSAQNSHPSQVEDTGVGVSERVEERSSHTGVGVSERVEERPSHTGVGVSERVEERPSHTGVGVSERVQERSETGEEAAAAVTPEDSRETESEVREQAQGGDASPGLQDLAGGETDDARAVAAKSRASPDTETVAAPERLEGSGAENDKATKAEGTAASEEDLAENSEASRAEDIAAYEGEDLTSPQPSDAAFPQAEEGGEDKDPETADRLAGADTEPPTEDTLASAPTPTQPEENFPAQPGNGAQEESMEVDEEASAHTHTPSGGVEGASLQPGSTREGEEGEGRMDTGEALTSEGRDRSDQDDAFLQPQLLEDDGLSEGLTRERNFTQEEDMTLEQEEELLGTGEDEVTLPSPRHAEPSLDAGAEGDQGESSTVPPEEGELVLTRGDDEPAVEETQEGDEDNDKDSVLDDDDEPPADHLQSASGEVSQKDRETTSEEPEDTAPQQEEESLADTTGAERGGGEGEGTGKEEPVPPEEDREENQGVPDADSELVNPDQDQESTQKDNQDNSQDDSQKTQSEDDDTMNRNPQPEDGGVETVPETAPEDETNKTPSETSSTPSQPVPEDSMDTEPARGADDPGSSDAGSSAKGTEVDPLGGVSGGDLPSRSTPVPGRPEESEEVRREDTSPKDKREASKVPPPPGPRDRGSASSSQHSPRPFSGSSSERDRHHSSRDHDHRDRSYDRNRGYSDHRDYRQDRDYQDRNRGYYDRHYQHDRQRDQRYDSQHGRYQQGGYGSQDHYYNQNRHGNRGGQNRHGYNDRNYYRGYY